MISNLCPRADLGCALAFGSSGDLDHHLRWAHGYRRSSRYLSALRPAALPPVGGRRAAAELTSARGARRGRFPAPPGPLPTGTSGLRAAATAGAARARRGRPAGGHRRSTSDGGSHRVARR
jgi:hypothetical protein